MDELQARVCVCAGSIHHTFVSFVFIASLTLKFESARITGKINIWLLCLRGRVDGNKVDTAWAEALHDARQTATRCFQLLCTIPTTCEGVFVLLHTVFNGEGHG